MVNLTFEKFGYVLVCRASPINALAYVFHGTASNLDSPRVLLDFLVLN